MASASLEELHEAVSEALRARGVEASIKARLRAEVFAALEGPAAVPAPRPSDANVLINELLREYLAFNGYEHALSVFLAESGQPRESEALPRAVIAQDLGISDADRFKPAAKQLPLLYSLVTQARAARADAA